MKHSMIIAANAVRELLFERALYLLGCFAALAILLGSVLGQMTYTEQAKLTMDFMLAATQISMLLFSVFMSISLFHREMTLGSISMVLSKPVSRTSFLLGKYAGQILVQTILCLGMGAITYLAAIQYGVDISERALGQAVLLILLEAMVIASLTYLFAVNSGAVTTAIATLCFFAVGHLQETIRENIGKGPASYVWQLARGVVPDLEVFNMKSFATYGQAITWTEFGWATAYAGCCMAVYLLVAGAFFARKDIPT